MTISWKQIKKNTDKLGIKLPINEISTREVQAAEIDIVQKVFNYLYGIRTFRSYESWDTYENVVNQIRGLRKLLENKLEFLDDKSIIHYPLNKMHWHCQYFLDLLKDDTELFGPLHSARQQEKYYLVYNFMTEQTGICVAALSIVAKIDVDSKISSILPGRPYYDE
jgi:hypothetical protein